MRLSIKFLIAITVALLMISAVTAQINFGKKLANRMVVFPLKPCIDTGNGAQQVWVWPDSVSLGVWAGSGADTGNTSSQVIYSARTATVTAAGLAALGIRADSIGTNTPFFVFCDSLNMLNAGTTARDITGNVTLWKRGFPFTTLFSLTVAADTALPLSINDTGKMTGQYTKMRDSLWASATVRSLTDTPKLTGVYTKIRDSIWASATVRSLTDTPKMTGQYTKIRDSIWASATTRTVTLSDTPKFTGIYTKLRDSIWASATVRSLTDTPKMTGQYTKLRDSIWASATTRTVTLSDTPKFTGIYTKLRDSLWGSATVRSLTDTPKMTGQYTKMRDSVWSSASTRTVTLSAANASDTLSLQKAAGILNDSSAAGSGASAADVLDAIKSDSIGDTSLAHLIAGYSDSGASVSVGNVTLAPGEYTEIADSVGALGGGSNWSDAQRDSLIARMVAVRDSVVSMSGWIIAKFDTAYVGAGIADSSRSTSVYSTNGDTVHVFKGPREYMTFIRKHPAAYPGARPDSTEAKR